MNKLAVYKKIAEERGGQCLSTEYKDRHTLMNWICGEFHVWSVGYRHIRKGSWCPNCLYKNESETRDIFEETLNKPFPKTNPKFLNLSRYSHLQLDGYNEELGIAFEYDGRQHYEISAFSKHNGKESLKERQQRDKIKDELCKKNMVKLIRIPYFIKDKKTYILNNLKEIGALK